jgi:hypothetical protein
MDISCAYLFATTGNEEFHRKGIIRENKCHTQDKYIQLGGING